MEGTSCRILRDFFNMPIRPSAIKRFSRSYGDTADPLQKYLVASIPQNPYRAAVSTGRHAGRLFHCDVQLRAAPDFQQPIRIFPRRIRLHSLRTAPGMGLRSIQPPLLPILTRIFMACSEIRAQRPPPARAFKRRAELSSLAVIARELGAKRFAVALSALAVLVGPIYLSGRKPAHLQLRSRSAALDGLRVLRDSRHQARAAALLALGWHCRGNRTRGEVFDLSCSAWPIVAGLLLSRSGDFC